MKSKALKNSARALRLAFNYNGLGVAYACARVYTQITHALSTGRAWQRAPRHRALVGGV